MYSITKDISDEITAFILDGNGDHGDDRTSYGTTRPDKPDYLDVARHTQRLEAGDSRWKVLNRDLKLIQSGMAQSYVDPALRILLNLPAEFEELVIHFLRRQ